MLYFLCLHISLYSFLCQAQKEYKWRKYSIDRREPQMSLKKQVAHALIDKDWSQRELARQMDISMAYLQDILLENRKPVERLKQIEELLDIKLETKQEV